MINKQNEKLENKTLWDLLYEIKPPEPSANMEHRFQSMLEHYKQEEVSKSNYLQEFKRNFIQLFTTRPQFQLAYSLVLVVVGVAIGYFISLSRINDQYDDHFNAARITALSAEVSEMRQVMMLSLLKDPSASQRLRAVNYTDEIDTAGHKVVAALMNTLNEDPNINVRLLTLDALAKYTDQPEVRSGLIRSITGQQSPLVQSALADLMLNLREKKSIRSLKELLKEKEINEAVKAKIIYTITQLSI